ncbi:helix-turn-helix transcriptional regulator [Oceanobacillus sp. Castelsardo]|uniref:helix-turn-helix domain-containing protein n=1 Tax=Oceanobacillus sp. Castelsardo TaxID=1851204 RepID=UPI0008394D7D|nr:helix-turn-helix transcriptional regulator [Oceanobacillus sp. Castelsardo]
MECRLKELLDGRTIAWLSDKTGVHRNTITSYIRGTAPQLDKAYLIADALNKSVYDIWPPN